MMRRARHLIGFALLAALLAGSVTSAQNRPDLQVTTPITVEPESTERGDRVTVVVDVTNESPVPVEASFAVAFQVRANGNPRDLGPDEITCTTSPAGDDPSRCLVPGLSGVGQEGSSVQLRAELLTTELAPGQYTIVAVADPDNTVAEVDDANNSGEGLLTVQRRLPNLTIPAEFSVTPPDPQQGDLLTLRFTVENDRPADIDNRFDITISFRKRGDVNFQELTTPALRCPDCALFGLAGNERRTIQAQISTSLLDPGTYQLRIAADPVTDDNPQGTIEEADEADNVLIFDLDLAPPPRNLTLADIRLSPQTPLVGRELSVAVTVSNESLAAVEGAALELTLTPATNGSRASAETAAIDVRDLPEFSCAPINELEAGVDRCTGFALSADGSQTFLARFGLAELEPGDYRLRARVDPSDTIVETDEADNVATQTFSIVEEPSLQIPQSGPELHPLQLTFVPSSPVPQGQLVLVSSIITNSGNRDAGAFRVDFSHRREDLATSESFQTFGTRSVDGLAIGKSVEKTSVIDTEGLEPGLYAVRVRIDGRGQSELDGNNNTMIAYLTIAPPPSE